MFKHPLFACLNPEQQHELSQYTTARPFQRHQTLIEEGQIQDHLLVIISGKACVTRKDTDSKQDIVVTGIGRGALVGESAAMLGQPAIAGVVAESDGLAASLDIRSLRTDPAADKLWTALLEGMVQEQSLKLEEAGTRTISYYRWQVSQLHEKRAAGRFTLRTLVCLGLYVLLASALTNLDQHLPMRLFVTTSLILICALATWLSMKDGQSSGSLSPADFGVSLKQWRSHALEAIKYTLPIMAGLLALKEALVTSFGLSFQSLFQTGFGMPHFSWSLLLTIVCVSVLLSVAQEFVVRCGIQSPLQIFYSEDRFAFPWRAILVSNILFAATYAHLSPVWALTAFVPGIFWGWLFARQNSLVGVSVSHALTGLWAILVFGFPTPL